MNMIRYYLALLLLSFAPPAVLFWFSIHPFIRYWRSVGLRFTLGIHYVGYFLLAILIAMNCKQLLSADFGTNPILIGLAIPVLVASGLLRRRLSRQLRFGTLTGIPELSPEGHKISLITEGVYSRIRHPRYLQIFLSISCYALFCNFLATYLLVPAAAITLNLLVWVEERELRERFGAEHKAYCARVPRFIPKRRS